MTELRPFVFSASAKIAWGRYANRFPDTPADAPVRMMKVLERYNLLLRLPPPTISDTSVPALEELELGVLASLGVIGTVQVTELEITFRPPSEIVNKLLADAVRAADLEEYEELVEGMCESVEQTFMQFIGLDGWDGLIKGDPLRHEILELMLVELLQISTGLHVADVRGLLDLWQAGRPFLGLDDEGRMVCYVR